jgi:hypothetical protein
MSPIMHIVPHALLEAVDLAIGSRDLDVAWAALFLLGEEFRRTGSLPLDESYLPFRYDPDLAERVRRGLEKLAGRRVGIKFDGLEVSLVDGKRR